MVMENLSKLVAIPKIAPRTKNPFSAEHLSSSTEKLQASSATETRSTLGSSGTSHISGSDPADDLWEYDVYATPFIPPALRSINAEMAIIVSTRSRHWVDFKQYVRSFVGKSFIPTPYVAIEDPLGKLVADSPTPLNESTYFQHFSGVAAIERAAKVEQNEAYAMYRVPLWQSPSSEDTWSLLVPGLREDSPHIEMGDVLQIRQLCVDRTGALTLVPMYVDDNQFGYNGNPSVIFKSWTGIQHDATVFGINRALEIVYIKADGLGLPDPGMPPMPMFANVVIPLKFNINNSQRIALVHISSELRHFSLSPGTDTSGSLRSTLNQFDKSPGAKYATPQAETARATSSDLHNDWSLRVLFPQDMYGIRQTTLRKVPHRKFFDNAINYEQAHAVNDVCNNSYGTLPYLISGPPGTGKTRTLVEIAMQLLNTTDVKHLLICAPSEAAADTLALRLKGYLTRMQLFRLNRPGRADNEVPRELLQYCHIENDMFSLPPFRELMAFNVVVTSCQDAAILAEARLTNNDLWTMQKNILSAFNPEEKVPSPSLHWTALLIDEAAQATELEVLPAISVVCPPSTYPDSLRQPSFVMAGDENQLGPRTASRDIRVTTSLFARLFKRPLYEDHPLSRSKIKPASGPPVLKRSLLPITYPPFTLLIRNYRSHPAILSAPSAIFYQNTLIPEAAFPDTPLQRSELWRGRKWPVLFLPHDGADEIERDGGGWYNVSEANMACNIAQTLVFSSSVQQSDICIMSPFAAQVKLMRALIRSSKYGNGAGLWDVNIGPLEAFQGLEKRVVILCTTRARKRFLPKDNSTGIGIVGEKRKMNVALTRAKEALFVIGNPKLLEQDDNWLQRMAFCWRNGLVSDDNGQWNGFWTGKKGDLNKIELGVLEKALIAREKQGKTNGKVLGAGHDTNDDYDAWVESLRETLEEDDEEAGEEQDGAEEHVSF
ncbi:helicase MOV-10 [Alternaria panax]|uniref:Helicase MOV-10 n=1 Tax=Alternaria panax TaxID=48097 RepID=A0AAD4FE94_9PLEO|nr:helicase MOV-10 [Alternaria panax]